MKLLGKSNSSIVVAHFTRLIRLLVRKRDSVVDVEDAVLATWRPDGSGGLNAVLLGVDLAVQQGAAAYGGHTRGLRLASVLREVVGRDEGPGYAFIEARPAVVGGVYHGVLEAAGVLQVQVELAVLAAVCGEVIGILFLVRDTGLGLPAGTVPGPM